MLRDPEGDHGMLFGNPKTVQVSTRAELDTALAAGKADEIVVEGDQSLLRYAEEKAGNDPFMIVRTEKETTFSVTGPTTVTRGPEPDANPFAEPSGFIRPESPAEWVTLGRPRRSGAHTGKPISLDSPIGDEEDSHLGDFIEDRAAVVPLAPAPARAPPSIVAKSAPSTGTRGLSLILVVLIACAAIAAGAFWYLQVPAYRPASLPPPQAFQGVAPVPLAPDGAGGTNLPVLAWAGVAVVAIVALYLIARQAIAGGQNVEISWKVTSKVEGKVIISRMQSRKQRPAKAA